MSWIKQKELASRLRSDIQASYDQLKTRNTYTNQGVMDFLHFVALTHNKQVYFSNAGIYMHEVERLYFALFNSAHGFMRSWRHREHKGYAYSNRNMAQDHVARGVLGQTKVDEVLKLAHCSSKSKRRKKRKGFKRQHQDELQVNEDTRRAIVAYGDASIRGTYREGRILHWSSRCPESRIVRQNNMIYPLKLCNQCPANGNNDLYWQRDVNAAANIRSILIEYIRFNFNIRSRPAALSKVNTMSEPIFVDLSDSKPTEIESLCMKCQENGITRILLSKIPHFKEIIIMAFECPHCGFRNNELQSAGSVNERGHTITLSILNKDDMNRQIVKSDYCSLKFIELDMEIPANRDRGLLTTVEGLVSNAIDDLSAGQPIRKATDEAVYNRIEEILATMNEYKEGKPFTLVLDDPSGNSYVENRCLPSQDPQIKLRWYTRTAEQQAFLGLQNDQTPAEEAAARAARVVASEMVNEDGIPEVMTFPANCPSCHAPCSTNMHVMEIPHFKEVVIMATNCEHCGYKSNEVKAGGPISDKGRKITLRMTDAEDLSRDILKSETCGLSIPEINLELTPGTLGGRFTTVEGLIRQVHDELKDRAPFIQGDSASEEGKKRWNKFLENLTAVADGQRFPVTLIIDDPLSNSYLQNLYAPDPDPEITIEDYERDWQTNEDLGLNDMKLDSYQES
ncbi:hypothetical protein G6F68_007145 [Rhizopus microsporus]|nr:hypothetical protein G6F68_007145 [Rhizopus microsporus]